MVLSDKLATLSIRVSVCASVFVSVRVSVRAFVRVFVHISVRDRVLSVKRPAIKVGSSVFL